MDPITQGLLGAATAQLGFRQKLGKAATWLAAGTAMLADTDIFITPLIRKVFPNLGPMERIIGHRGISHSLFAVPVFALIIAGIWYWRRRSKEPPPASDEPEVQIDKVTHPEIARQAAQAQPPRREMLFPWMLGCTFLAALSHPLLDWMTSYGTQLLTPMSDTRFALHAIGIIDIIYSPLLVLTLVGCYLVRRFSRAGVKLSLLIGYTGMALSCAYLGAGLYLQDLAKQQMRNFATPIAAGAQQEVVDISAYPYIGTIFLWRGVAELEDRWVAARIRPIGNRSAEPQIEQVPKQRHALIDRAMTLDAVKTYRWFTSDNLRTEHLRENGEHVVLLHDMRYGRRIGGVDSMWPLRITFDYRGNVQSIRRQEPQKDRKPTQMIGQIWREIWR